MAVFFHELKQKSSFSKTFIGIMGKSFTSQTQICSAWILRIWEIMTLFSQVPMLAHLPHLWKWSLGNRVLHRNLAPAPTFLSLGRMVNL